MPLKLQPGDHLLTMSGGGAGMGKPEERDPESVRSDVRNELVSVEMAQEVYKTEKIKCDTSLVIFVPKNLLHLPFFCRNVRKPLLHMVIGLNIGETPKDTRKYPARGI
jgi:hypothetical protein